MIDCINDYGLWNHLNRSIIDTLLTIDIIILGFFGYQREIASYTIALKFSSLFSIIPMQIGRSLQVLISNYKKYPEQVKVINTVLKVNFIVSTTQLLFVILSGEFILHVLFGNNIGQDAITYSIILVIGISVLNIAYPIIGILNNKCKLKSLLISTYLPALFVGGFLYCIAAYFYGGKGLAYGKIMIFAMLNIALAIQVYKNFKFKLDLKFLNQDEKLLIKELFNNKAAN